MIILFVLLGYVHFYLEPPEEQPIAEQHFIIKETKQEVVEEIPISEEIKEEVVVTPPVKPKEIAPKEVTIIISHNMFSPKEIEIEKGTTVTWLNQDTKVHEIYHNDPNRLFHSRRIKPGNHFSYKFREPGTYRYNDAIFLYMNGKIIVKDNILPITGATVTLADGGSAAIGLIIFIALILILFLTRSTGKTPKINKKKIGS